MHCSALLLILVSAGAAAVHGNAASASTPAARFWEKALPGTPMPEIIAELVQKGIDHSPLKQQYSAPYFLPSACLGYSYRVNCGPPGAAMAATGIFFHEEKARVGSVMTVSFPAADLPAILPRDVAEKAPFDNITDVLTFFNIAPSSTEASKVAQTLRGCREQPLAGEQMACATSLEGTVRAAMRMLGTAATRGQVWVAASSQPPRDGGLPRQQYAVSAVAELDGDGHVACHDESFPYAVFRCHMKPHSSTKAYMITLSGLNGGSPAAVAMLAVCHMDTSDWNPAHPAFGILHTKPGGAPVCHFMPYADLLFGVKAANA